VQGRWLGLGFGNERDGLHRPRILRRGKTPVKYFAG
jgi:hypothetical protein